MEALVTQTPNTVWGIGGAYLCLIAIVLSASALLALHIKSPEFAPSWRMVSEYANGEHKWLLSLFFLGWAVSSLALIWGLLPLWGTTLGKASLLFLALASVGQLMGMAFDINHPLHGVAAMIGIPAICISAVVVTWAITEHGGIAAPPAWTAHLPWISFVLILAALFVFFSSLKSAGVDLSGKAPLTELPEGVLGYVGWANRLLILACYLWAGLTAILLLQAVKSAPI